MDATEKLEKLETFLAEQRKFFRETEEGKRLALVLAEERARENAMESLWRKRQWERGEDVE